jgi:hypothetical protein
MEQHTYGSSYVILPDAQRVLCIYDSSDLDTLFPIDPDNHIEVEIAQNMKAVYNTSSSNISSTSGNHKSANVHISKYKGTDETGFLSCYDRSSINASYIIVTPIENPSFSLESLNSILSFTDEQTLQEQMDLMEPLQDHSVFGRSLQMAEHERKYGLGQGRGRDPKIDKPHGFIIYNIMVYTAFIMLAILALF